MPAIEAQQIQTDQVDVKPFVERFKSAPANLTDEGKVIEPPAPPKEPDRAPDSPEPIPEPPKAPEPPPAAPEAPKPTVPDIKAPTPPADPPKAPKPGSKEFNVAQLSKAKDEIEAKYKTAAKELEELKAKWAAEAAKPVVAPDEVEKLKTELTTYQQLVAKTALQEDPRFQAAFDQKITQAITEAVEAIDAENAPKISSILKMPPGKERDQLIKEAAIELDDFARTTLVTNYTQQRQLEKARADELAKAKDNLKQLKSYEETTKAELAKKTISERMTFAELQLREAAKVFPEFAKTGDADHDKLADETHGMVRNWLQTDLTPPDQAKLAVYAARGIRATEMLGMQQALIAKLEAQIRELTAASPDLSRPGTSMPAKAEDTPEAILERWRKGPTQ